MNLVLFDVLVRHLLWTGDREYARQVWPNIQRHLAWEKRFKHPSICCTQINRLGPERVEQKRGHAGLKPIVAKEGT